VRGLIIREPWIGKILDGMKMWEIRSTSTKIRGPIALIRGGSGLVVGTARVTDSIGPLSLDELTAHEDKHAVPRGALEGFLKKYKGRAFAWVLEGVRRLDAPVAYDHPSGAVIWVTLPIEQSEFELGVTHG